MTDIPFNLLLDVLVFLLFPLLAGYLAARYKISPIIGYMVGGIFLNLVFADRLPRIFINNFSILGLVLLIFTIGLETNFQTIKRFGKFVLLGGILQILLSAICIFVLSSILKFSFLESLFFGFAFALSSTAVVSKIIQERGEENSLIGGLALGVLIFQDVAFIPLLIIFSSFGQGDSTFLIIQNVLKNSLKAAFILGIVYYVGLRIIPLFFNRIAKVSREVLNLFIVVFIVASLSFFSFFGLSSLLAAFIAGVLLSQTYEHYHIFSQIRPLRDTLAVVFFVYLGLSVEFGFVVSKIIPILTFASLVIFIKIIVVLGIYLFFKFHSRTAFTLSIFLFQIGEDAFILVFQGFNNGVISREAFNFALSVVLMTLLITPFLIARKDLLYNTIRRMIKNHLPFLEKYIVYNFDREAPNIDVLALKNHVIICGYGRIGSYIGRALMLADVPFIAIDYNFHTVERAKKEGINIIYGDPTEIDVLDYGQCDDASVLVSAVPESFSQEMIIFNAKKLNPKLVIFTRVHQERELHRMKDLGVEVVVQPEFEASLSIIRRILFRRGFDRDEIARKIKRLKIEHGMI
ncbi:cation:proton antiporter [Candidatus Roizmanbacteria bacterium]|nr:cation:proton antiporter [Candidatus Roizmanbacteria bacterium]